MVGDALRAGFAAPATGSGSNVTRPARSISRSVARMRPHTANARRMSTPQMSIMLPMTHPFRPTPAPLRCRLALLCRVYRTRGQAYRARSFRMLLVLDLVWPERGLRLGIDRAYGAKMTALCGHDERLMTGSQVPCSEGTRNAKQRAAEYLAGTGASLRPGPPRSLCLTVRPVQQEGGGVREPHQHRSVPHDGHRAQEELQ